MIVIEVIQYSLAFLMIMLLSHQLARSIWTLITRRKIFSHSKKDRHFAIVISATEDKQMISKSLYSLFGLAYPRNLYDVIIMGDCFSKDAVQVAKKMGAIVLNEGKSLHGDNDYNPEQVFEQIMGRHKTYDAILVVESESLVSGNYLDVINYYLDQGSNVVQSNKLMLPQSGLSGYERQQIHFLLNNLLKPTGQKTFGFSDSFKGNDLCFSTQTLRDNDQLFTSFYNGRGDMEGRLLLQLNGIKVDFAPEAVVWRQMSTKNGVDDLEKNHRRRGKASLVKRYLPEFVKAAIRNKSISYFERALDLIAPSVITMLIIALLMVGINIVGWALGGELSAFIWAWLFVSILGIANIFAGGYAINTYFQAYKSIV